MYITYVDKVSTVPATQVFALFGLLWLSLKIFSFWRLIVSLFVLPGVSVSQDDISYMCETLIFTAV